MSLIPLLHALFAFAVGCAGMVAISLLFAALS